MILRAILLILSISFVFAQVPVIKIISPMEAEPIIAYEEISIYGELLDSDKLFVNNYNVDLQNGLFRLKFKFSETGYREFVFRAENVEYSAKIPSIVSVVPSAWIAEWELADLFGLDVENATKGVFIEPDAPQAPLRKGEAHGK